MYNGAVLSPPGWEEYLNKVMRTAEDIVSEPPPDFKFHTAGGDEPSRTFDENNPPDTAMVVVGGGGLPSTPWTPGGGSPGSGNSYTSLPDLTKVHNHEPTNNYGVGDGGDYSPSAGSAEQKSTTPSVELSDGQDASSYPLGSWLPGDYPSAPDE
tara:strand:- start:447 stop:908 length:462 start_codon:yes stop_codon:yes gene_type:complete